MVEYFSNVIDVGALDSQHLEQHEYMDRSRAYSKRIEMGGFKVPSNTPCLLKDIPAPERVLAAEPLAPEDHELVKKNYRKSKEKKTYIFINDIKPSSYHYTWNKFVLEQFSNFSGTEDVNKVW